MFRIIHTAVILFLNIVLCQSVLLTGTYLDKKFNPIQDAKVNYAQTIVVVDSATTSSDGSFSLTIPNVGVDDDAKVARDFGLTQNYPNPFNPTTRFTASLKESGSVTIYNILGQQVSRLNLPGFGEYTITWGGASKSGNLVSAGVYFYVLRSGENVTTRKMTLLDKGDGGQLGIVGWNVEKDIAGVARTLPSLDELSFVKDNTSTLLLNFNTPESDTSLGTVTGNIGPDVLNNDVNENINEGDTARINLNDFVYNDENGIYLPRDTSFSVLDSIVEFIGENPGLYSTMIDVVDGSDASLSDSLQLSINVSDVNHAPVAGDDIPDQSIDEGSSLELVLNPQYVTDVDNDVLQYLIETLPNASYTVDGDTITITPDDENYNGNIDNIVINVSDGQVAINLQPFNLTVNPVNDAPEVGLVELISNINEDYDDLPQTIASISVSDIDVGDVHVLTLLNDQADNAYLNIDGLEVVLDSLTQDFNGIVNYGVIATDSSGAADTSYADLMINPIAEPMNVTFKFIAVYDDTLLTGNTSTLFYRKMISSGQSFEWDADSVKTTQNGLIDVEMTPGDVYSMRASNSDEYDFFMTTSAFRVEGDSTLLGQTSLNVENGEFVADTLNAVTFEQGMDTVNVYKVMQGFPVTTLMPYLNVLIGSRRFPDAVLDSLPFIGNLNYTAPSPDQQAWANELCDEIASTPQVFLNPSYYEDYQVNFPSHYIVSSFDPSFPYAGNSAFFDPTTNEIYRVSTLYQPSIDKASFKQEVMEGIVDSQDSAGSPHFTNNSGYVTELGKQAICITYLFNPKTVFF